MNRRTLLLQLLGLGAGSAYPPHLWGQREGAAAPDGPVQLAVTFPETIASGVPRFFAGAEFADFRHLGDLLVPAFENKPGAAAAEAAEFLDFLLSESPDEAQVLYRNGVRRLGVDSQRRYRKAFAQLTADEAAPLLAPLQQPWTYQAPADPYARFLQAAKTALFQATINSRQWAQAQGGRSRAASGMGAYWLPIE